MDSTFIIYLGVGRLLIYIVQKFVADATKVEVLKKWASCDLCAGVWIFSALAYFLKITILSDLFQYVPFVSEVITGCVASFMMHLLVLGWKTKFDVVVI